MSWLTFSGKEIQIGEGAADILNAVVDYLSQEAMDNEIADILRQFIAADADDKQRSLAVALQFLGAVEASDLLVTAKDLRSRVDNNNDGKLGWGALKWSTELDKKPEKISAITLGLELEGGAYFEVFSEAEEVDIQYSDLDANSAVAQIVFLGKISGQAGLKSSAKTISGSFSVNGSFNRSYKLLTQHSLSSPEPIGVGVSRSLRRIANPADLSEVAKALRPAGAYKPVAIQYSGGRGIGTDAKIKATIVSSPGVAFQLNVGAKLQFGNAFEFDLTRDPKTDWVSAKLSSKTTNSRSGEIGLGVKVGLSGFGIDDVSTVLKAISDSGNLIDDLDKKIASVKTWLKPGEIIRGQLERKIRSLLNTTASSGEADKRKAIVSWQSFAALVGFEKASQTKAQAQQTIASGVTDRIIDLIDDSIDLFAGGQEALTQKILEELSSRISKQALAYLQSDVLDAALPDLWGAFKDLGTKVDKNLHAKLGDALGLQPDDLLKDIATYLDRARSLLSQSAAAIEKASTNLLSAELQAWLAVSNDTKIDLSASFQSDDAAAESLYKTFILNPEKGIQDIRDSATSSVELNTGWKIVDRVRQEEGVRWSLTLLDFSLSSTAKTITDVEVIETDSGIAAASKAESVRQRSFRNETRSLSFISASRIYFSRDDASISSTGTSPNEFGPLTAPTLELSFTHEDGRLKPSEAEQLLDAFTAYNLVDRAAAQKAIDEVRERSTEIGQSSINGSLSIGLAIPPEHVISLLQKAAKSQSQVIETTSRALASIDPESIIETYTGLGTPKTGLADFANNPSEEVLIGALSSISGARVPSLSDRSALALEILNNLDALKTYADQSLRRLPLTALGGKNSFLANLDGLKKTKLAVFQALKLGQDVYQTDFSSMTYSQVKSELKSRQTTINNTLAPFFRTGFPLWDVIDWLPGLKERSPKRLVSLYAALLELSSELLEGYTPPLRLTVSPKNEAPIIIRA